jgi:adenylate cyclase
MSDRPRLQDRFDPARASTLARLGLVAAGVIYCAIRFGAAAGLHVLLAGVLVAVLELAQARSRAALLRIALIGAQFGVIVAVAFAPAPLGFGSTIPGPVMMESPLFLLLLCFLASYAASVDPWLMAGASLTLLAAWSTALYGVSRDPRTITRANLHLGDYKTALDLMRAVNQPHYFHDVFWRAEVIGGGTVSLVLCFAAFRVRRLAARRARQEGARQALAAHFSPQIAALLSEARTGLAPDLRRVAVLDCDLVRFSTLAEGLSPERVAELLNLYRTLAVEAVFRHQGAVLNFAGDDVVAVFGLISPDAAASQALRAAKDLAGAWAATPAPGELAALPPLAIGIDLGEARVGVVGEGRALSLLIQGPPVDGAARLQQRTRASPSPILLSAVAARALGSADADPAQIAVLASDEAWSPMSDGRAL